MLIEALTVAAILLIIWCIYFAMQYATIVSLFSVIVVTVSAIYAPVCAVSLFLPASKRLFKKRYLYIVFLAASLFNVYHYYPKMFP